jgi:mycothiol synthase
MVLRVVMEVSGVKALLKIRPYVKGSDDETYVRIFNACFNDYDDIRRLSMEDFRKTQTAPNYSSEGLLIAEWDGSGAGMVDAYVDPPREEPKGFVQSLSVLPEFRRRGIGRELVKKALESLKARGMKNANAWAQSDREGCVRLYRSFGFHEIRVFSMMKASLASLPSEVGENKDVTIRSANLDSDEDVRLLNWLDNETFKEHFNFRPRTLEETRYMLFEMPWFKGQKWFFAEEAGKPVGYLGTGIDVGLNEEKDLKWGWILDIGVLKPERRLGIGACLMLHGMRVLKDIDMKDALLYVDDMNPTAAIKLYEKVGFTAARKNLTLELKLE